MKKLTKLLTIGAILLAGIFFSGCGVGSLIQDTYNHWYKYEGDIGDVALEKTTTPDVIKNVDLYFKYNSENGLTVALQTTREQNVELLKGLTTYPMEIIAGQVKQYDKASFGPLKWEALYLTGTIVQCEEPEISRNPEKCIVLGDIFDNGIQWETFLKKKLVEMILGEDLY